MFYLLALFFGAAIANPPLTQQCLLTSEEFGNTEKSNGARFDSHMNDVLAVGEKVMFMRTASLLVCSSTQRIHGIQVALRHDPAKDPAHNEFLDNFYSGTAAPDHDKTFYTSMLGVTDGDCDYVYVSEGEKIEAVVVHHDERLIRVLEFKSSTGRVQKVGLWTGQMEQLDSETLNLTHGEEIVGLYGGVETETTHSITTGEEFTTQNFASLGFIMNQCEDL